jgi:hypothetical protein
MPKRKRRWMKNPDDLRYRMAEALFKSIPIVALYVIISATAQLHSNSVFDENEIHNLSEGAPAMALAYALLRIWKIV